MNEPSPVVICPIPKEMIFTRTHATAATLTYSYREMVNSADIIFAVGEVETNTDGVSVVPRASLDIAWYNLRLLLSNFR